MDNYKISDPIRTRLLISLFFVSTTVVLLGGCGTVVNLCQSKPAIYGGVQKDFEVIDHLAGGHSHRFAPDTPLLDHLILPYFIVDIPYSVAGDTFTLPVFLLKKMSEKSIDSEYLVNKKRTHHMNDMAQLSDKNHLITAGNGIYVWSLPSLDKIRRLQKLAPTKIIEDFDITPDDKHIGFGKQNDLFLQEISTGEVKNRLQNKKRQSNISIVRFFPSGERLIHNDSNHNLIIRSMPDFKKRHNIEISHDTPEHASENIDVEVLNDNNIIYSTYDGHLVKYDQKISKKTNVSNSYIRELECTDDHILAGTKKAIFYIDKQTLDKEYSTPFKSNLRSMAVSPRSKFLATGHESGKIKFWSLPQLKKRVELEAYLYNTVESLLFEKNGDQLISSSESLGKIRIWTLSSGLLAEKGNEGDGSGGLVAMLILSVLVQLAIVIALIAGFWAFFTKAGQPGWGAIIPIYNLYLLILIADKPGWWLLLFFVPVVQLVIGFLVARGIAEKFGKGIGFTLGLFFIPYIFCPILGFGSATYQA